jgi:hypothetical protein
MEYQKYSDIFKELNTGIIELKLLRQGFLAKVHFPIDLIKQCNQAYKMSVGNRIKDSQVPEKLFELVKNHLKHDEMESLYKLMSEDNQITIADLQDHVSSMIPLLSKFSHALNEYDEYLFEKETKIQHTNDRL